MTNNTFIKGAGSVARSLQVAKSMVRRLELDLRGLCVVTECASGPYSLTPVLALLAGARVHALGRDTSYGKFSDNAAYIRQLLQDSGIGGEISFSLKSEFDRWSEADIVTNSGLLRPIAAHEISRLKQTAVIPLMWEPWEFRSADLDLPAAQKHGIPVIGTNEHFHLADMFGYPGMLAMHLLFSLGIEGWNNRIVLLGGGLTGELIAETFRKLKLDVDWYTSKGNEHAERCFSYNQLPQILEAPDLDVIICADHVDHQLLIGKNARISFADIKEKFPFIGYGHICGHVDVVELAASGVHHLPLKIKPAGYMSYEMEHVGFRPVIELCAAGLKVGELAARERLAGKSIEETILAVVEHGIGLDFENGFMHYKIVSE